MGKDKKKNKLKAKCPSFLIKSIVTRHGSLLAHVQDANVSMKLDRALENLKIDVENRTKEDFVIGARVLVAVKKDGKKKFRRAVIDTVSPVSVDATDLDTDEYYFEIDLENVFSISHLRLKELIEARPALPYFVHGFHKPDMMVNPKQLRKVFEVVKHSRWHVQVLDHKHHIESTLNVAKISSADGNVSFGTGFELEVFPKNDEVMPPLILDAVETIRVCAQEAPRVLAIQPTYLPLHELRRLEAMMSNISKFLKYCDAATTEQNHLVAAFYNGRMVRGYVLNVTPLHAEVYLMDYGVVQRCRFQRMRFLTKDYSHEIPRYGARVFLPAEIDDCFEDSLVEMSFGEPVDAVVLSGTIERIVAEFSREPFEASDAAEAAEKKDVKEDETNRVDSVPSVVTGAGINTAVDREGGEAIAEKTIVPSEEKPVEVTGSDRFSPTLTQAAEGGIAEMRPLEKLRDTESNDVAQETEIVETVEEIEAISTEGSEELPSEASAELPDGKSIDDQLAEVPSDLAEESCCDDSKVESRALPVESLAVENEHKAVVHFVISELVGHSEDLAGAIETKDSSLETIPEEAIPFEGPLDVTNESEEKIVLGDQNEAHDVTMPVRKADFVCFPAEEPADSPETSPEVSQVVVDAVDTEVGIVEETSKPEDSPSDAACGDITRDGDILFPHNLSLSGGGDSGECKAVDTIESSESEIAVSGTEQISKEDSATEGSEEWSEEDIAQVPNLTPETREPEGVAPTADAQVPVGAAPEECVVPESIDHPESPKDVAHVSAISSRQVHETIPENAENLVTPKPTPVVKESSPAETPVQCETPIRAGNCTMESGTRSPELTPKFKEVEKSEAVSDARATLPGESAQTSQGPFDFNNSDPVLIVCGGTPTKQPPPPSTPERLNRQRESTSSEVDVKQSVSTFEALTTPREDAVTTENDETYVEGQFDDAEDTPQPGENTKDAAGEVRTSHVEPTDPQRDGSIEETQTELESGKDEARTSTDDRMADGETPDEKLDSIPADACDNDSLDTTAAVAGSAKSSEENLSEANSDAPKETPTVTELSHVAKNQGKNSAGDAHGARSKKPLVVNEPSQKLPGNKSVGRNGAAKNKWSAGSVRSFVEYPHLSFRLSRALRAWVTRIVDQHHLIMTSNVILAKVEEQLNTVCAETLAGSNQVEHRVRVGGVMLVVHDTQMKRACVVKVCKTDAETKYYTYLLDYPECVVTSTVYACPPQLAAIHRAALHVKTMGKQTTDEHMVGKTYYLLIDYCENNLIHGLLMPIPKTEAVAAQ